MIFKIKVKNKVHSFQGVNLKLISDLHTCVFVYTSAHAYTRTHKCMFKQQIVVPLDVMRP